MSMRDAALNLARQGLRIFKVKAGAKFPPVQENHFETASALEGEILKRWSPEDNSNPAVACGDQIVVLDIDVRDGLGGKAQLRDAVTKLGQLPATYTVMTPTGGMHIYFKVPHPVSGVKAFGDAIDVKTGNAYVLGEGAVTDKGEYVVALDAPIAELPQSWLGHLKRAIVRHDGPREIGELDTPTAILAASDWLSENIENVKLALDPGNYATACRVREFGVSEQTCFELMSRLYLPFRSGEHTIRSLRQKVAHAYEYAKSQAGVANPETQFDVITLPPPPTAPAQIEKHGYVEPVDTERDMANLPRRQWIMRDMLLRGAVSSLVAPGASGKSTLTIACGVALALARGGMVGAVIPKPVNVLFINNEDPKAEFERRLDACLLLNNIGLATIKNKLFLHQGATFTIAVRKGNAIIFAPDRQRLREYIEKYDIGVVFVDPLVETHEAQENDNVEMSKVVRAYREIAEQLNISICLVHHSKKPPQASSDGFSNSMDAGRGASAVINAVRIGMNFFPMSEKDAEDEGVPTTDRYRYVRLDNVKANLSFSDGQPAWFEKVSVPHPNGEEYGALRPVSFENVRNNERHIYIDAMVANDGNDNHDFADGVPLKAAAAMICHDQLIGDMTNGDTAAIVKRLTKLFRSPCTWNGYTAHVSDDGKGKNKWLVYLHRRENYQ
ncbi:AAA family ATPase [Hyphomicrobium sp. DY-1]|uniref:AAA family ATPase n=1 Tax=Hyphomicrobium sp. DY-1 TaxID=3075650 RepID=UPI0039C473B5